MVFPRKRQNGRSGPSLSDFQEGTLIKIRENGTLVDFYVAKHDYESSLNGAGRTLVVRKDCYDTRIWNSPNVNEWASCSMRFWLNRTYKALLDANIQEAMGTTIYRYTLGNGNNTVTTRSDSVFLLSLTELDRSNSYANTEGSALPIASTLRIAYLNGSRTDQWTRSPYTYDTRYACYLDISGNNDYRYCYDSFGSRPAFTLPSTTPIDPDTMEVIA